MNKKLTDYVIDLVEILNKQQKQVFWGIFDIFSMVVSIIVSYILFYGLINPAPVDYIIYTSLAFLFYQLMIGYGILGKGQDPWAILAPEKWHELIAKFTGK